MDSSFICLETGSTDPYYNLAFEEYILTHRREGSYLILWQNDNTIVIGLNQNTEAEINRDFVEAKKIRVVRRTTGGGAVYHDLGNLNYSFITDTDTAEAVTKKQFTDPVISALRSLGIHAEASGRNDILADGRKVSGTAQRIDHGRILHHGTLLFDSDPSAVEGALNVDPEKFKAKGIPSVRSRIGNIRPLLKQDMTIESFRDYLLRSLTHGAPAMEALSEEELLEVQKLRDTKYNTWEWNYGRSPSADMHFKKRFSAGNVEIFLSVLHGVIQKIRIFGDFLAVSPIDPLEQALIGTLYREDAVLNVLDTLPLASCLGGISREEFLSVLFS